MKKKDSDQRKAKTNQKMLDTVSRLKRVIGAADHKENHDHIGDLDIMHVYVTDRHSSTILQALFHQFTHSNRPVFYQKPDGTPNPLPLNESFGRGAGGLYEVETFVPPVSRQRFIDRMNKYIETLVSPNSRGGHTR